MFFLFFDYSISYRLQQKYNRSKIFYPTKKGTCIFSRHRFITQIFYIMSICFILCCSLLSFHPKRIIIASFFDPFLIAEFDLSRRWYSVFTVDAERLNIFKQPLSGMYQEITEMRKHSGTKSPEAVSGDTASGDSACLFNSFISHWPAIQKSLRWSNRARLRSRLLRYKLP